MNSDPVSKLSAAQGSVPAAGTEGEAQLQTPGHKHP